MGPTLRQISRKTYESAGLNWGVSHETVRRVLDGKTMNFRCIEPVALALIDIADNDRDRESTVPELQRAWMQDKDRAGKGSHAPA